MNKAQEAKLVLALQQGDEKAVARWFFEYHDRLVKVALLKVSSKHDAEELVQETFLNCMKQMALFRGGSTLWTWMNAILRHEISDYYRKKYAKKALKTLPLFDKLQVSEIKSSSDISGKVTEILTQMRADYRELLLLKYIDKLKVAQIADMWGRSTKAIESDLFRARKEFQYLWLLEEKS